MTIGVPMIKNPIMPANSFDESLNNLFAIKNEPISRINIMIRLNTVANIIKIAVLAVFFILIITP